MSIPLKTFKKFSNKHHRFYFPKAVLSSCELIRCGRFWAIVAIDSGVKKKLAKFKFAQLACTIPADITQLDKDIKRSPVPSFLPKDTLLRYYSALENILIAYCNASPKTGYMQGMNIIAASILFSVVDKDYSNLKQVEESTFELFYSLMEHYGVKEFYATKMERVFVFLHSLETVLFLNQPALLKHIKTDEVGSKEFYFCLFRVADVQSGFTRSPVGRNPKTAGRRVSLLFNKSEARSSLNFCTLCSKLTKNCSLARHRTSLPRLSSNLCWANFCNRKKI